MFEKELTEYLKGLGASLIGFGDLSNINQKSNNNMKYGISIAVKLNYNVVKGIKNGATKEYYDEYNKINDILNSIADSCVKFINDKGYNAIGGINIHMFKKGDFHIHSNYSDGRYGIKELLDLYKKEGYDIICLTDHDTLEGCKEAIKYGKEIGIKVITGIEISTKHNGEDVHILGYFKDEDCRRKEMIEFARKKEQDRINRCKTIVSRLKQYFDIEIDGDELLSKIKGMIGRSHIAKEIIKAGYESDMQSVFDKYLGNESPAYIPSSDLSVQEGINLLKNNNAVIVMAHPVLIKKTKIEDLLNQYEFDGIEAIYGMNSQEDTDKFIELCKERDLLITGGSDFHDFNTNSHSNIGDISLDDENIDKLLKLIQSK